MDRFNIRANVIASALSFGVNAGLVFLSYRLIIQQNGIAMVGLWSTLFAWTSLIRVGDVGMANATLRFVALKSADSLECQRDYVETGFIANVALYLALTAIGYFLLESRLPNLIEAKYLDEARKVLPIMFAGFFLFNLAGVISGAIQGLHLGYIGAWLGVAGNIVQIALVFALVPRLGLAGLAWAQVAQYGAIALLCWLLVRGKLKIRAWIPLRFHSGAFREMLNFSLKAQAANISNGLFEPVSKILVGHFGGLQVQGLYEMAFKVLWLPRNGIISGVSAMIPSLTALHNNSPVEFDRLYSSLTKRATLAVFAVSLSVLAASPLIAWLWTGHTDPQFSGFVAILAGGIVANAYGAPAYNLAIVTGNMQHNILVNVVSLVALAIAGTVAGLLLPSEGLIAVVALIMAAGGVAIKAMNEKSNLNIKYAG